MKINAISLICICCVLSACQSIDKTVSPNAAIKALQLEKNNWTSQVKEMEFDNNHWLNNLNDSRLDHYIDIALRNNFSLQANASQLAAQLKNVRISAARQWPAFDANLRKTRNETNPNGQDSPIVSNSNYSGDLTISWEIDLWQRLSAQKKASAKIAQASAADYQAARLSLVAGVARAWFNLNNIKLQVDIAEKRLASIKESLEVVEEQYKNGSQSALNVYLNRTDFANQQSNIIELKNALQSGIRDFRVLLGEYPDLNVDFQANLPTITKSVPAGLPAELVIRRPDVLADLYEWQSSAYDADAAQRARYPSFSLTATYGASSESLSSLDEKTLLWNVINNLSLPLFRGGQLKAQADASKYLQDASFKRYLATLLRSFNEVETALSTETSLKTRLHYITQAASLAESGYELALEQYRAGISSYQDLLESRRRWFDAQIQLVNLKNDTLQNRISLNLALGGDFSSANSHEKINIKHEK